MPSVVLSIPTPIVSTAAFFVEIKDGGGSTVYTNNVDNNPFAVTLPSGDYTAYYTFEGNTQGWCFTIPSCDTCLEVLSAAIIERDTMAGNYDLVMVFDFSTPPTPDCGFILYIDYPGFPGEQWTATALGPLGTPIGGGIYEFTLFLGTKTSISYKAYQFSAPDYGAGEPCIPPTVVNFDCTGAFDGSFTPPDVSIILVSGIYSILLDYNSCGGTCGTIVWNYLQKNVIGGGAPDSGTFTDIVTCSPLTSIAHTITPHGLNGRVTYDLIGTDCCGNTYSKRAELCTPIIEFTDWSLASQPINSNIRIVITACNANPNCPTTAVNIQWIQQTANVATGSIPDTGFGAMVINCGALPAVFDFTVNPAPLAVGQVLAKYSVLISSCCINQAKTANISP